MTNFFVYGLNFLLDKWKLMLILHVKDEKNLKKEKDMSTVVRIKSKIKPKKTSLKALVKVKPDVDPQGSHAYYAGLRLEKKVEKILVDRGVYAVRHSKFDKDAIPKDTTGLLLKHVPYIGVTGGRNYGEFLLSLKEKGHIRIECRSQRVPGSADDKLISLYYNMASCAEYNIVIVIDGNGFRKKTLEWLYDTCVATKHKNIRVVRIEEFDELAGRLIG